MIDDSLAVIIMNYRRPRNIGRICRTALEALPRADVILLDQAEDDECIVHEVTPQVQHRRAQNEGCIARLRLAASLPYRSYLAIDDDLFLTRRQIRDLATYHRHGPERVHGLWGQKVFVSGKNLRVENSVVSKDIEVTILNQAYAFSRTQAADALGLIEATGFDIEEIRNCDDILLSSAGELAPQCHDVGAITICQTADEAGVAIGTSPGFHEIRARLMVSLLKLGRLHVFPLDADPQGRLGSPAAD